MIEGWFNDDYLILFNRMEESRSLATEYGLDAYLPRHRLLGIKSWDDFIISDEHGEIWTLPTIPLDASNRQSFDLPPSTPELEADRQYAGKIKWYLTPLVFGGSPTDESNMTWISRADHPKLVNWWNKKYRELQK
ncbi:hypothetical protein GC207_08715 [bacterium]|nr:hypothetical protein [bacterium]